MTCGYENMLNEVVLKRGKREKKIKSDFSENRSFTNKMGQKAQDWMLSCIRRKITKGVLTLLTRWQSFVHALLVNILNHWDLNRCYRQHIFQTIQLWKEEKIGENHIIALLCKIGVLSSSMSSRNIKTFFYFFHKIFWVLQREALEIPIYYLYNMLTKYSFSMKT